jgi:hypothetical protein
MTSLFNSGDGWYAYDQTSHVLTPRANVYFVRTSGGVFALRFLSYYDAAGTSGFVKLTFAPTGG